MTQAANEDILNLDDLDAAIAANAGEAEEGIMADEAEDDVMDALADLDLEDIEDAEEVVEASAEEVVEEDVVADDEALEALDAALEREEVYQAQAVGAVVASTDPVQAKPIETKKAGGSKTPGKPRASRDISTVPDEFFVLEGDVSTMSAADKTQAKTDTIALRPGQVKVAEKFDNLFGSLSMGREPSKYVVTAFQLLDNRKIMSSADLVAAYKTDGLGEGTARSQTGQIMALFAAVKIAVRAGQTLTLNENSALAERLRKIAASASA